MKIPVFQKGGAIIPQKNRIRRSSSLMKYDPYTLVVALDRQVCTFMCHYINCSVECFHHC